MARAIARGLGAWHRRRHWRASALHLPLLLAAGGCNGAVGNYSAIGPSLNVAVGGGIAPEAACLASPNRLWVAAGRRNECLHYSLEGIGGPRRTALVYIAGDPPNVAYGFANGSARLELVGSQNDKATVPHRGASETSISFPEGIPSIVVSRPGINGSSGNHARDRHTNAEVALIGDALTQLRIRYGFEDFAIAGFSSGGVVAANLLAGRSDIRCAVLASAPLDLAAYYRSLDGTIADRYAFDSDLADPMRNVRNIRTDTMIWVFGDSRDRKVPASSWASWAAKARDLGLPVIEANVPTSPRPEISSDDATFHRDSGRAVQVAFSCAVRMPTDTVKHRLQHDQTIAELRADLSTQRSGSPR